MSINETHLDCNDCNDKDHDCSKGPCQPSLPEYTWIGHCRVTKHRRANRHHGGVGILVKNEIYSMYHVSVIDRTYDGILGVLFTHKITDYQFIIFTCYLPPQESPWGRDENAFYSHLLGQIYLHNYVDCVNFSGDVNERVGKLDEILYDLIL